MMFSWRNIPVIRRASTKGCRNVFGIFEKRNRPVCLKNHQRGKNGMNKDVKGLARSLTALGL